MSTLDLKLHHPTSYLVVVAKRSDIGDINDWSNYTHWITSGNAWSSENEFFEPFKEDDNAAEEVNNTNYSIKGEENIIKSMSLTLNGVERFRENEPDFYNKLMPFSFGEGKPKNGILFYSFALNPFSYQPSGSCNMSRFSEIKLNIETALAPIVTGETEFKYKFDIDVYAVNYNILRIFGGMGNVEFSN